MQLPDLIDYTRELIRGAYVTTDLHNQLIKAKAEFHEYERSLFVMIVVEHSPGVDFIEDSNFLKEKLDDSDFLDGVYSDKEENKITFYDSERHPLLCYEFQEEEQEEDIFFTTF